MKIKKAKNKNTNFIKIKKIFFQKMKNEKENKNKF